MFRFRPAPVPRWSVTSVGLALCISAIAQGPPMCFWSGALSPVGIRVNVMVDSSCTSIRLMADDEPDWSSPEFSDYGNITDSMGGMVHLRLEGLLSGVHYRYRFERNGTVDTAAANTGSFRTPAEGPASFTFVAGSCNSTGDHPVWESMGWSHPLFFLSTGDLHYGDPNSADVQPHRDAYVGEIYTRQPMMDLLHEVPLAYVWDDHDFCGNGSHAGSVGRASAARAYRDHVPHYDLPDDTAIHQAFTIGRVRFILSDLRSEKTMTAMMSDDQHAWLKGELLAARDSGLVTCWVTPLSWNALGYPENWGAQPDERAELADWLRANAISDLFMIAGDAHMLAIDDGANTDFSTGQDSPYRYPVFQAAALDRFGSYKGGEFNQGGVYLNPSNEYGQFGQVTVDDDGLDVCITFDGWRTGAMDPAITLMNSYTFCRRPLVEDGVAEVGNGAGLIAWYDGAGSLVLEDLSAGERSELIMVDAMGRVVVARGLTSDQGRALVSVGPVASGVYTIRLRTADREHVSRFAILGNLDR